MDIVDNKVYNHCVSTLLSAAETASAIGLNNITVVVIVLTLSAKAT